VSKRSKARRKFIRDSKRWPNPLPRGIQSVSIHPSWLDGENLGWEAIGWGEYEDSSVLAGQTRRVWLDRYETREEAEAAWPMALTHDYAAGRSTARVSRTPEPWFDPMDAGEAWGEDDY
jgi:hypothetical protein